jgi:hypothetical protein
VALPIVANWRKNVDEDTARRTGDGFVWDHRRDDIRVADVELATLAADFEIA